MISIPERVKDALRNGDMRKNYIIQVLADNTDEITVDFTIDNDTLVKESVKLDERMATGSDLKFGLCEGSSFEFQYFEHPNIRGRRLRVFIDIQYVNENNEIAWHRLPMGFFDVDQCSRQVSTGIQKVVAYNKLKSAYLDQKFNTELMEETDDPNLSTTLIGLRNYFLSDYEIMPYDAEVVPLYISAVGFHPDIALNITITDLTDEDTPLCATNLNIASTLTTFKIRFVSVSFKFNVAGASYFQINEIIRTFTDCQNNFITYMKNMFDASSLSASGDDFITAINNTTTSTGVPEWGFLFGVAVSDQTESSYKYYSDYAYRSGVANIEGSVRDLVKLLLSNSKYVNINFPVAFEVRKNNILAYRGALCGDTPLTYTASGGDATYPVLTYPDGSYIPYMSYQATDPHPYVLGDWLNVNKISNVKPIDLTVLSLQSMPDFTLRDLISASYETVAQYGKLDRQTDFFAGVELNYSRLLPADTLYPDNALYPGGNSLRSDASMYQKLWTDSQGVQTFRYLIITYKAMENGQEVEKTLQRTVHEHGTTNYNMSDNWLFRNLVWTAEEVGAYADAMVEKMRNVSWFPFEMWCAGLPYIETGDELEITNSEGTYTSYVLQRQLNGIQNLQDTYINGELDIF